MRRVLLAVFILALTACGLETWPYLLPPLRVSEALPSSALFTFRNQATSVSEFRGFELYYKFLITEDIPKGFSTLAQLNAEGFFRMYAEGPFSTSPARPLIGVHVDDRNTNFEITMDFTPAVVESEAPSAYYGGTNPPTTNPIPIRRRALDDYGDTKTFEQAYLASDDEDMINVVPWPGIGQPLYLVVYVISYGVQDYSTDLYSDAVYLGYMRYTIP